MWLILKIGTLSKDMKSKIKFCRQKDHDILRLFNILPIIISNTHDIQELPHE